MPKKYLRKTNGEVFHYTEMLATRPDMVVFESEDDPFSPKEKTIPVEQPTIEPKIEPIIAPLRRGRGGK